jgi:hypothetical protein
MMETISLVSCGWPKDCANGQIGSFLYWLVLDIMVSLSLLRVGPSLCTDVDSYVFLYYYLLEEIKEESVSLFLSKY